jgi:endonuclease/exonuclease/phosphatase family metal-dependent hydrolase
VGLLAGGFAFCNPYTGGAAEAHCCASALGWSDLLRYANPLGISLVLASYGGKVFRALGLSLLELGLALFDCVRGVTSAREALRELKFIPSRVGVCVFLRELAAVGASMAAARGVPVIQLNFLGYDEQSHQRGPDSAYAHWSLKAIDQAIRQIWNAAHQATGREYSVWVYSDHGQQKVTPYEDIAGRTIQEAVAEAFSPLWQARSIDEQGLAGRPAHRHSARSRYLRRGRPHQTTREAASAAKRDQVLVAAVGPLGHLYLPVPLPWEDLRTACRKLAADAGVPLVLVPRDQHSAAAWTEEGEFELPRDAARLLGDDHPFLAEAAADLTRLCQHPQAGDIVIAGWRAGAKPVSFVAEFGAHGGVSPEETRGFALLPADTRLPESEHDHIRPAELRAAALHVLGRADRPARPSRRRRPRETVRIATYNVHSCLGMDGRLSASRIARVLARCDADVIALQEIDVRRRRSQFRDQAHEIARELQMQFHFHPALALAEERYGDAVLSRRPMRLIRADQLPGVDSAEGTEPRGALWVAVDLGDRELQLINTHLGLLPHERMRQVQTLLGENWLGHPDCRDPLVLCGDLNLRPDTPAYSHLAKRLRDAQRAWNGHRPKKTWFSHYPLARIDHVFVGQGVQVVNVDVPRSQLARVASDHLPLIVDLRLT